MARSFDAALGALIARAREDAGMSQEALAQQLARDQPLVSRVEHGMRRLTVEELIEWASALGTDPETLFASVLTLWETYHGQGKSIWVAESEDQDD